MPKTKKQLFIFIVSMAASNSVFAAQSGDKDIEELYADEVLQEEVCYIPPIAQLPKGTTPCKRSSSTDISSVRKRLGAVSTAMRLKSTSPSKESARDNSSKGEDLFSEAPEKATTTEKRKPLDSFPPQIGHVLRQCPIFPRLSPCLPLSSVKEESEDSALTPLGQLPTTPPLLPHQWHPLSPS